MVLPLFSCPHARARGEGGVTSDHPWRTTPRTPSCMVRTTMETTATGDNAFCKIGLEVEDDTSLSEPRFSKLELFTRRSVLPPAVLPPTEINQVPDYSRPRLGGTVGGYSAARGAEACIGSTIESSLAVFTLPCNGYGCSSVTVIAHPARSGTRRRLPTPIWLQEYRHAAANAVLQFPVVRERLDAH